MAKFRVERGGGEYVFPSIGLVANDGDVVDLPSGTNIDGLVPNGRTTTTTNVSTDESVDVSVDETTNNEGA